MQHSSLAGVSNTAARKRRTERALALRPNLLDAQMFLANLLVGTGKVEQAVRLLRDALKTNGNNAATHWELGYAYRFAGMLDEAVAECERARELDPLVKANGSVFNTYLYWGNTGSLLRACRSTIPHSFSFTVALENFTKRSSTKLRKILIVRTNSTPLCTRELERLSVTRFMTARQKAWIS